MRHHVVFVLGSLGAVLGLGLLAGCGDSHSSTLTTGAYAPIEAAPVLEGNYQDPDAGAKGGSDVSSIIRPLGNNHYELTVTNTGAMGFINTFIWAPPPTTTIAAVTDSSTGHCTLSDGSISCKVVLGPPTCTCRGDGGRVTIAFTARPRSGVAVAGANIGFVGATVKLLSETPVPYIIPSSPLETPSANADLPFCKKGELGTDAKPCVRTG